MDGFYERGVAPLDMRLLTTAELRLAAAVVAGKTNVEIAREFALATPAVETAIAEVCRKLGVSSRTELAILLGALADAGRHTANEVPAQSVESRKSERRT